MATATKTTGAAPEVLADLDAIMQSLAAKKPVAPEVLRRVEDRANLVIDELRRKNVQIDIEKLLQDARDDS